eukprot:1160137-Pelagomonas_calceolata.AAC.14
MLHAHENTPFSSLGSMLLYEHAPGSMHQDVLLGTHTQKGMPFKAKGATCVQSAAALWPSHWALCCTHPFYPPAIRRAWVLISSSMFGKKCLDACMIVPGRIICQDVQLP